MKPIPSLLWLIPALGGVLVAEEKAPIQPIVSKDLILHGSVRGEDFGTMPDGRPVRLYLLDNGRGLTASVMNCGATLVAVETPDRAGQRDTVTLRLGTFDEYLAGHPLFGSVVGRYANRIDRGGFTIDGVRHDLATVNPKTGVHIHGGKEGFATRLWEARIAEPAPDGSVGVIFSYASPAGQEGYPGNLTVNVTYTVTPGNALRIDYEASTDRATHVNLTNHAYWNLAGAGSGDVLGQELTVTAGEVLEVDDRKIPTGRLLPVAGTPFDFTQPRRIGVHLAEVPDGGYDHCYVLDAPSGVDRLKACARLRDPGSGRIMEVLTTQPGIQVYTANYLTDNYRWNGHAYGRHHAVCLETQHFPDSPNRPEFPSTLVRPGAPLRETTVFRFSVE